jgi:hypothetical protein
MKTEIIESKFDDGIYIKFKNLKYIDDYDILVEIIDKNIEIELIENIDGIWSRYRTYKAKNFIFQLMYHEDLGNCLRLPLNRDSSLDKEHYELLREMGKEVMTLFNTKKK